MGSSRVFRILGAGVVIVGLLYGAVTIAVELARNDEERIRIAVGEAVEEFNASEPRGAVAPLHDSFRDEQTGIGKKDLQRGLFMLFRNARDANGSTIRCAVDLDTLVIEVDEDRATMELELAFERRRKDGWQTTWRVAVRAGLEQESGDWTIRETEWETLEGRRLW